MCEVRGAPVVDVHLPAQGVEGGVREETGDSRAGVCPDDVRWLVIVPGCCFRQNTCCVDGVCHVGADCEEALLRG